MSNMIKTQQEVESFLRHFMPKFDIIGNIKISMGYPNSNTICISFHEAEHPIDYAFKK